MSNQWKCDEDFVEHDIFEIAGLLATAKRKSHKVGQDKSYVCLPIHHSPDTALRWKTTKVVRWFFINVASVSPSRA